ncbi:RpiB/LacA/LacB family sugar-phosphate isomerase [Candidatus Microgenomates bacterium]|nr:RpiB/LacA/LacB family sugar-phosphate isomerase [Candidatus Microgenomates bacterium]
MVIYLATDHAGFELKEKIKKFLQDGGYEVEDFGAYQMDAEDDYPDFISKAAQAVSKDPSSKAIILGGSGQGEAIVANKFPNIRTTVFYGGSLDIVKLGRQHNDANVLSLGARFLKEEDAIDAVKLWLETPFTNEERHIRRIEKIKKIEIGLK